MEITHEGAERICRIRLGVLGGRKLLAQARNLLVGRANEKGYADFLTVRAWFFLDGLPERADLGWVVVMGRLRGLRWRGLEGESCPSCGSVPPGPRWFRSCDG